MHSTILHCTHDPYIHIKNLYYYDQGHTGCLLEVRNSVEHECANGFCNQPHNRGNGPFSNTCTGNESAPLHLDLHLFSLYFVEGLCHNEHLYSVSNRIDKTAPSTSSQSQKRKRSVDFVPAIICLSARCVVFGARSCIATAKESAIQEHVSVVSARKLYTKTVIRPGLYWSIAQSVACDMSMICALSFTLFRSQSRCM